MKDKRLVRLVGQGKTEYINDIAQAYYDDIYRFCCFETGDREWAYDLTQETFLRFIRYVDGMREGNLKGYLLTIAMNVCRDGFRERKLMQGEEALAGVVDGKADCRQAEAENRVFLEKALFALPNYQREAIVLYYYYGFGHRQIAAMTGTGVSTVKSRIRQGCEKMRRILGEK